MIPQEFHGRPDCGVGAAEGGMVTVSHVNRTQPVLIGWCSTRSGLKPSTGEPRCVPSSRAPTVAASTSYAEGGLRVWVDGKPGDVAPAPGDLEPSDHSLYIGADHGVSDFLNGYIHEVRLYRVALSDEEIRALARG